MSATITSPATPITPTTPNTPAAKDIDQLVATLRNDPSLHVFLSDDFSPQAHVGAAVVAQRVEPALQDAQRASTVLSASVRQHVIRRKEALLAEVEAVDALEREVTSVSAGVTNLVTATTQLSDALDAPYTPMSAAVNRASNIAQAIALVSSLQRFRVCTDRLRSAGLLSTPPQPTTATTPASPAAAASPSASEDAMAAARNLPAAAEAAKELEQLLDGNQEEGSAQHTHQAQQKQHQQQQQQSDDALFHNTPVALEKIDGVAKDAVAVRKAIVEVRKRAATLLKNALAERNQTDVEAAVMSFHALGMLQERVTSEIARLSRETQAAVHKGLEGLSSSASSKLGSSSALEKHVWEAIELMLNAVADACFKALLLQHVLSRRYCPTTHVSLVYDTIASSFIESVAHTIHEQVSKVARLRGQRPAAARVFILLAEGYPKFTAFLKDLSSRVFAVARALPVPITKAGTNFKLPIIPDHDFIERAFLGSVVDVETQYLTASLERLTKTVNSLFENGQPGETEALNFTKMLASELDAAKSDRQLKRTAISNVATALRLYTSQAEDYAAASAPDIDSKKKDGKSKKSMAKDSSRLSASRNDLSGWYLTTMYNGMVALATSGSRVLGDSDDGSGEPAAVIAKELDTLSRLSELLLDGPFSSCRESVGVVIQRMHTEDLEGDASGDDGCSVYVLDVATQLSMFADSIIPALARSRCLGTYTLQLAQWALDTFVLHATLVFPQGRSETRTRLATDMARMESAVDALCPARLLGRSYHQLRALRVCILSGTENFITPDDELQRHISQLPLSSLAQSILGRCNDPLLLQPHRRLDQTPARYVEWLRKHSEEDAWNNIQESLNVYTMRKDKSQPNAVEYNAVTTLLEARKNKL